MKKLLIPLLFLAAALPVHAGRKDWKIGLQCWTFNGKSLLETVDYCAANGIRFLEIYPGQKLGEGFAGKSGHTMSAEECAKLRVILKQKGVSLLSYGVVRAGPEAEWRQIFDFAKRMGIATIIAEPALNQMEMLDKLTAEYGVNVGIHNHGEPTPDMVAKLLDGRSKRIGIAPDNGHWTRRGIDNLGSLKRFEGRILSIHLKDLNDAKRDVPFGEGTTPVAGILAWLDQADYKGPIIIEYEAGNQQAAVRKCVEYLKSFIETAPQHDARMQWWRDARFGMFIHWGVYAVPAGVYQGKEIAGPSEWILKNAKIPMTEYQGFAKQFNPVKYDPDAWVRLAKEAGMKYIVITSKHHDGFALFDSKASDWNVVKATPYGKDLLKPLAEACKKHGIKLGFYYSQARDWHHPGGGESELWVPTQKNGFDQYFDGIAVPQVKELLSGAYGPVDVLWFDTPLDMNREKAERMVSVVRGAPSNALISSRLLVGGKHTAGLKPDQLADLREAGVDYLSYGDRQIPHQPQWTDWETCMTTNTSWGYQSFDHKWRTAEQLVRLLISVAGKGGNFLLNVGPTAEGEFPPEAIERLQQVGKWMKVNGEAIYGTGKSPFESLPFNGSCTCKPGKLFLHICRMPAKGLITLPLSNNINKAYLLANPGTALKVEGKTLTVPSPLADPIATVVVVEITGEPDVIVETPPVKKVKRNNIHT